MLIAWCIGYSFTVGITGDYSITGMLFKLLGWPVVLGDYIRGKLE